MTKDYEKKKIPQMWNLKRHFNIIREGKNITDY